MFFFWFWLFEITAFITEFRYLFAFLLSFFRCISDLVSSLTQLLCLNFDLFLEAFFSDHSDGPSSWLQFFLHGSIVCLPCMSPNRPPNFKLVETATIFPGQARTHRIERWQWVYRVVVRIVELNAVKSRVCEVNIFLPTNSQRRLDKHLGYVLLRTRSNDVYIEPFRLFLDLEFVSDRFGRAIKPNIAKRCSRRIRTDLVHRLPTVYWCEKSKTVLVWNVVRALSPPFGVSFNVKHQGRSKG